MPKSLPKPNYAASAKVSMVMSSPMRTRWIADLIRGKSIEDAGRQLLLARKKSAAVVRKLLLSAVSNAEQKGVADLDRLYIHSVYVDEGPRIKRFMPRAQGRADRRLTRTSHIFLGLSERSAVAKAAKASTKAKAKKTSSKSTSKEKAE